MKCIQISDLHIGNPGEINYQIDSRKNFHGLMQAISREKADFLAITGDLAMREGEKSIYDWLQPKLPHFKKGVFVTPGNHDDRDLLRMTFPDQFSDLPPAAPLSSSFSLGGETFHFLDSSPGAVSKDQLEALNATLQQLENTQVPSVPRLNIFMHHPPVFGEVRHMDTKYALENMDEVQKVVEHFSGQVHVFCGHYHVEKTIVKANMTVYITPSNYFQVDQETDAFTVDHYDIGYRIISWQEDTIRTWVRYIEAPGSPLVRK
jgi:3',5'-cyclic-AMP phosphodiesterase